MGVFYKIKVPLCIQAVGKKTYLLYRYRGGTGIKQETPNSIFCNFVPFFA